MQRTAYLLFFLLLSITVEARPVQILSWNVFMLPKPIKYSLQVTRTKLIVEELKKVPHDVVVLNEAFDRHFRSHIKKDLKKVFPYRYYLGKEKLVYPFISSGVYVLSKLPFKVLDYVFFDWCATADCMASKGAVGLEFAIPGGAKSFQLAATHLQSEDRFFLSRFHQMNQIKDLLDSHQKNGVPQLIVGDINIDGRSQELVETEQRLGMTHLSLEGEVQNTFGHENKCYKTVWGELEWLDHVLVNTQGASLSIKPLQVRPFKFERNGNICELSDHLAVETTLQVH